MPRREVRTEPAGRTAADDLDLSRVAVLVDEGDPRGNLIALLQRAQERVRLPARARGRRDRAPQRRARLAHPRHHHVLRAVQHRARAAATRSASATAPPATWPAPRASREAVEQELGVADGATTDDMEFTLDSVACMGACSQAPVMRVDDDTYGNLSADQTRKVVRSSRRRARPRAACYGGAGRRWAAMPEPATPPARPAGRRPRRRAARPAASAASRSAPAPPACSPAR